MKGSMFVSPTELMYMCSSCRIFFFFARADETILFHLPFWDYRGTIRQMFLTVAWLLAHQSWLVGT